jgi:hypothetical protein
MHAHSRTFISWYVPTELVCKLKFMRAMEPTPEAPTRNRCPSGISFGVKDLNITDMNLRDTPPNRKCMPVRTNT